MYWSILHWPLSAASAISTSVLFHPPRKHMHLHTYKINKYVQNKHEINAPAPFPTVHHLASPVWCMMTFLCCSFSCLKHGVVSSPSPSPLSSGEWWSELEACTRGRGEMCIWAAVGEDTAGGREWRWPGVPADSLPWDVVWDFNSIRWDSACVTCPPPLTGIVMCVIIDLTSAEEMEHRKPSNWESNRSMEERLWW